jgi:hypothetical protein
LRYSAIMVGLLVVVMLLAQNDSLQNGTASLSAVPDGTRVTIAISGEPAGAVEPANIHDGTCEAVQAIRYGLPSVRNGRSTTILPISYTKILRGRSAIVVQASPASLHAAKEYKYVSCGPIPSRR